jgi:hypothetical protein
MLRLEIVGETLPALYEEKFENPVWLHGYQCRQAELCNLTEMAQEVSRSYYCS